MKFWVLNESELLLRTLPDKLIEFHNIWKVKIDFGISLNKVIGVWCLVLILKMVLILVSGTDTDTDVWYGLDWSLAIFMLHFHRIL